MQFFLVIMAILAEIEWKLDTAWIRIWYGAHITLRTLRYRIALLKLEAKFRLKVFLHTAKQLHTIITLWQQDRINNSRNSGRKAGDK